MNYDFSDNAETSEHTSTILPMDSFFTALAKRQLRGDDEETDPEHCPSNFGELSHAEPIIGNTTFHRVMLYTSAATMLVSVALGTYMILGQMFSYREPRFQKL